jgi:excisionase family DNA binding protein
MINFTVEEAADRLRKGRTWTWGAIRSGELKSFKIGARRLVSEDALDDFIRSAQAKAS